MKQPTTKGHESSVDTFSAGPESLSAAWLTTALRDSGAIKHAAVLAFSAAPLENDAGLFAQLSRVRPTYDREEAGAPRSLIAKFSSTNPQMRARSAGAYRKEVRFYQHLAPRTTLPVPACYFGEVNMRSGSHLLLLEDMAPARSGSRIAGCSPAQARLVVHHIARFHADWWEHPELGQMAWLPDPDFGADPRASQAEYETWWSKFEEATQDRLPDPIRQMGERLGAHRAEIERHLFNTAPRTLLHGDYHLGNMVFGGPEGGRPFAVLDWQMLRRGRGVRDVAYFLSENLLPEVRRAVEMDLLADYHRILIKRGVTNYTFAHCLDDYGYSLLQRFRALVSTIAVMPFAHEARQMHIDILLPRNTAAILDHNADRLLA